MSAWNDLVSKVFKEGKAKNPNFSLKDAMVQAKGQYKKGATSTAGPSTKKSRKARKSRKSRKGGRKSRKH